MSDCFAYNQQRQRCTLEAGHDSLHVIAISWSDDESFDPATIMDIPTVAAPPFDVDPDAIREQVARAEAAWENRASAVDTEALEAMDFGRPADPPTLVDNRCVACDHQHATGKCRCGCETFIPRLQ